MAPLSTTTKAKLSSKVQYDIIVFNRCKGLNIFALVFQKLRSQFTSQLTIDLKSLPQNVQIGTWYRATYRFYEKSNVQIVIEECHPIQELIPTRVMNEEAEFCVHAIFSSKDEDGNSIYITKIGNITLLPEEHGELKRMNVWCSFVRNELKMKAISESTHILQVPASFSTSNASGHGRNTKFDHSSQNLGVVVSARKINQFENEYKVYPFFTGYPQPHELVLRSNAKNELRSGEWIRFDNQDLVSGQINPRGVRFHDEWFVTMPFLNKIAMECDIIFNQKSIRTRIYKPKPSEISPAIPFIQDIKDDLRLLPNVANNLTKVCAIVEYESGTDRSWHIRHLKPQGFSQRYW